MHLKEVHINWSPFVSKWQGTLVVKLPNIGEISVPIGHEVCRDILAGIAHSPSVISTCTQAGAELHGVCSIDPTQFSEEDPFHN